MTSVFIVAASFVTRAGLEALIAGDHRFTLVGSAALAQEAAPSEDLPNIVLLVDIERQTRSALDALNASHDERQEGSRAASVVLIVPDEQQTEWAADALRAGASAVLPRSATEEEILAALEAAACGLVVLHKSALDALLSDAPPSPAVAESLVETLTPREVEVLGMIGEGLGNKTIAYRLGISEHTVKFHVASIFGKLGVASRTEAVTQGLRRGLILL